MFFQDTSNDRVKRSPFGRSSQLDSNLVAAAAEPEFKTLPYPRIGKRFSQNKREPGNMIPMARIGKRFGLSDDAMFEKPRPEMGQMFKRVVWNNLLWNARFENPIQPMQPASKRNPYSDMMFEKMRPDHPVFKKSDFGLYEPQSVSQMFDMPRYGRSGSDNMIPMARIGKRDDSAEDNYYKSIPMPRIG